MEALHKNGKKMKETTAKNVYQLAQERLDIIFKEFDNVYTFANRCSSLEINELIKSLRHTFGDNGKADVIAAYLGYYMDDKKIKEDMSRLQTKAGTLRLKVNH